MRKTWATLVFLLALLPWLLAPSPTRGRRNGRAPMLVLEGGDVNLGAFEKRLDDGIEGSLGRMSLEGRRMAVWRLAPPLDAPPEEPWLRLRRIEGVLAALGAAGWKVARWETDCRSREPLPDRLCRGSDFLHLRVRGRAEDGAEGLARRFDALAADWMKGGGPRNLLLLCRGYEGPTKRQVALALAWGPAFQPHPRRPTMAWDGLGGMLLYWAGLGEEARKTLFVPMDALSKGYVFHHDL